MADKKISELPELPSSDVSNNDWIVATDTSENTSKKINFGDYKLTQSPTDTTADRLLKNTDHSIYGTSGRLALGTTSPEDNMRLTVRDTNTMVAMGRSIQALAPGDNNGGAVYFGVGTDTTDEPTAAIEASWGGTTLPQVHFGVTRDGNKTRYSAFNNNTLRLYTDDSERMRINGDGDVGIGRSNPAYKMDVNGDVGVRGSLLLPRATTEAAAIEVGTGRSGNGNSYIDLTGDATYSDYGLRIIRSGGANSNTSFLHRGTGQLTLTTQEAAPVTIKTSNTERVRVANDGFLAGTTNPSIGSVAGENGFVFRHNEAFRASRSGDTCIINRNDSDGAIILCRKDAATVGNISVTATSTSYNTSSDYRLKEDVQPMSGAAERVRNLKPVNFAWKTTGQRVDGFLAHEAQEVVPEAVTGEKDGEDMQTIDQSKLVPILTAALQEALQKIDDLETRLEKLEATQ